VAIEQDFEHKKKVALNKPPFLISGKLSFLRKA